MSTTYRVSATMKIVPDRLWARVTHTNTRKIIHIIIFLEVFNLWAIAESILYRYKQQFGINVKAGIVRECLVGPHGLPQKLTGDRNRDFLLTWSTKATESVSLAVKAWMWHTHDDAPESFSRVVRDVLCNTYHERWISRGGLTGLHAHRIWILRIFTSGDT